MLSRKPTLPTFPAVRCAIPLVSNLLPNSNRLPSFLFVTFDAANDNVPITAAGFKPWDPTTFPYENTISDEELRTLAPKHNKDAGEVTAVAVSQQWP